MCLATMTRMRDSQARESLDIDQFFERHLLEVVGRLEANTRQAVERQHAAWRDSVRREAALEGKDFEQSTSPERSSHR
jgi:hypothetical protein